MQTLDYSMMSIFVEIVKWGLTVSCFVMAYGFVWAWALYREGKQAARRVQVGETHTVYYLPKNRQRRYMDRH